MAREINNRDLKPIIDAGQKWIQGCLIRDGSVFSSEPLWTPFLIQDVKKAFVDHPDTGGDSFGDKLHKQMQPASPPAQRLMAEMLWAILLFPSNVGEAKKREQIRNVWNISGEHLPDNHPMLSDAVLPGIGSGGQAYNNLRWMELRFLIEIVGDLKQRNQSEREKLFSSYDAFVEWINTFPKAEKRQFKHMLRYLAYPDRVERMSSNNHRHEILARFAVAPEKETRKWTDSQLDDALLKLRTKLQAEHPGRKLDFYEEPLWHCWSEEDQDGGKGGTNVLVTPFAEADALQDLFIDKPEQLGVILSRLRRKKALILQGPPGVGKTFVARRIAYALMGYKDDSRIHMVQFHPSYGYEDFVQGYRPTRAGSLERRDGVFYEFARSARNNPQNKWVFIIDEINRGNLAKIFGELLMLLEADKRGSKNSVSLTYSEKDEEFFLPENLFVIGTMNTADRSLAMVDYALRRRFAFATLGPALDTNAFATWFLQKGASKELLNKIRTGIARLNSEIIKERDLGEGFCVGHSFFCPADNEKPNDPWYSEIIDSEIKPLLKEYFESPDRVETLVKELLQ